MEINKIEIEKTEVAQAEIEEKIYKKMIAEKLSFAEMSKLLEPPISAPLLSYHIKKYCKENSLELPKFKVGRKTTKLNLKIKE